MACGGLCGTPAVEIDQVQQDAKSGCLVISNNRSVTDRSKLPIRPAEVRRKEPGQSNTQIASDAILANLGVSVSTPMRLSTVASYQISLSLSN